jgi:pimeloyl-ACP methyl ester carboxylesterase
MKTERPDFWREFRAARGIPIAVLRGANSEYLTPGIVERMLSEHPSMRLHTIPDCGHPVMLWEPEAFAAVEALLARADDPR